MSKLKCNFCGGFLGATETQRHSNPNFAEYKTCLKCGYQWAKAYWHSLEDAEEGKKNIDRFMRGR